MLPKVRTLTKLSSSPHQPATADSQLQNAFGHELDPAAQLRDAVQHQYRRHDSSSLATARIVKSSAYYNNAGDGPATLPPYSPTLNPNDRLDSSPSRFRSQQSAAPTATMSPIVTANSNIPVTKLGEARIEQVEKELRDQKNMLAQILGAVQEFRGSPGSESRA